MRTKKILALVAAMISNFAANAQYGDYEVRVEVSGNGFAHFTTIYFDDESWDPQAFPSYGWDPCCDALLILGTANQPQVFTEVVAPPEPVNNHRLSINGLPHLFEETEVPLGFLPGTLAPYVFTFKNLYTLPQGTVVELEDMSLNVTQDLMVDSTYDTWGAPSDDEGRFTVRFFPSNVTDTGDSNGGDSQIKVINEPNNVRVSGLNETEAYRIRVFGVNGQVYKDIQLKSTTTYRVDTSSWARGVLIVAITEGGHLKKRQKVVLF